MIERTSYDRFETMFSQVAGCNVMVGSRFPSQMPPGHIKVSRYTSLRFSFKASEVAKKVYMTEAHEQACMIHSMTGNKLRDSCDTKDWIFSREALA
jgi:hypothetical protein